MMYDISKDTVKDLEWM